MRRDPLPMGDSNRPRPVIKSCPYRNDTGRSFLTKFEIRENALSTDILDKSPFLLANESEYQAWRARKLRRSPEASSLDPWQLGSDNRFDPATLCEAQRHAEQHNFVVFESRSTLDKRDFLELNRQLGLVHLDNNLGSDQDKVTSLQVLNSSDERAQYIPYTNRALNWHTDGYYNETADTIRAFSLYCVSPAERGGGNFLFDHEMMYLLIRDTDPELIAALMNPDIMTIPANVSGNKVIRPQTSCAVFSIDPGTGRLQMRYTSRPRNITWSDDKRSERALKLVREILIDDEAVTHLQLGAGQGLICNNLLHGREAFRDSPQGCSRLMYRARYYDFIETECDLNPGAAA